MMRWLWLVALAALTWGCQVRPPIDPNDPAEVGIVAPEVLRRSLQWAWDAAAQRVMMGEITEEEARAFTRQRADELVGHIDVDQIPHDKAFAYGEVYRTAERWEEARVLFERALEHAPNDDLRVNSALRLAQSLAHLDQIEEALAMARAAFDAPDHETAPILPSVLYEIIPAAEGKGYDAKLAALLEDAIAQHQRTIVDPESEAGMNFFLARPVHTRRAWGKVAELYRAAGQDDGAARAAQRGADDEASSARL